MEIKSDGYDIKNSYQASKTLNNTNIGGKNSYLSQMKKKSNIIKSPIVLSTRKVDVKYRVNEHPNYEKYINYNADKKTATFNAINENGSLRACNPIKVETIKFDNLIDSDLSNVTNRDNNYAVENEKAIENNLNKGNIKPDKVQEFFCSKTPEQPEEETDVIPAYGKLSDFGSFENKLFEAEKICDNRDIISILNHKDNNINDLLEPLLENSIEKNLEKNYNYDINNGPSQKDLIKEKDNIKSPRILNISSYLIKKTNSTHKRSKSNIVSMNNMANDKIKNVTTEGNINKFYKEALNLRNKYTAAYLNFDETMEIENIIYETYNNCNNNQEDLNPIEKSDATINNVNDDQELIVNLKGHNKSFSNIKEEGLSNAQAKANFYCHVKDDLPTFDKEINSEFEETSLKCKNVIADFHEKNFQRAAFIKISDKKKVFKNTTSPNKNQLTESSRSSRKKNSLEAINQDMKKFREIKDETPTKQERQIVTKLRLIRHKSFECEKYNFNLEKFIKNSNKEEDKDFQIVKCKYIIS